MTLVCPECFGKPGLKQRLINMRRTLPYSNLYEKCSFHPSEKGIPISDVIKIIDDVFRYSYEHDKYQSHRCGPFGKNLHHTLDELTKPSDIKITYALFDILIDSEDFRLHDGERAFYNDKECYVLSDDPFHYHAHVWLQFKQKILHEQRFFNSDALEDLKEIFDGFHNTRDDSNDTAVYEIKPDSRESTFFRARISISESDKDKICQNPEKEMGPPPKNLRTAGRMNSSGIPAFYGAFDIDTCIAEIRPTIGKTIFTAKFNLSRPILVLDMTKFSGKPRSNNIFSEAHIEQMHSWNFMSTFMKEIAKPCLPKDEHLDYIPTQVVSEYLHHHHKFSHNKGERSINAIIYQSTRNGAGKNIAIFGDAGSVEGGETQSYYFSDEEEPGLCLERTSVEYYVIQGINHEKSDGVSIKVKQLGKNKYGCDF